MRSTQPKFRYSQVIPVVNWGCSFDSLTELKFAISISEEYHFLRSPVSIYYHPGTLQLVTHIRRCHLRYTPDFLIRHKMTGKAFLVEIKPRAYQNEKKLLKTRQVAENLITAYQYDWKYQLVFDDEIILTSEQLQDFMDCTSIKSKKELTDWAIQYGNKISPGYSTALSKLPNNKQVEYLLFGRVITLHSQNK